ncbi:MAG: hypothetical protein ACPIOQ_78310 [Promethearchaeia archaeon]
MARGDGGGCAHHKELQQRGWPRRPRRSIAAVLHAEGATHTAHHATLPPPRPRAIIGLLDACS